MAVNGSEFKWTAQKARAAQSVADDKESDSVICERLEIPERTLNNWKKHPDFQARVTDIVEKTRQAILTQGIADKVNRVAALNDRWERMRKLIDARATEHAGVPGGETGVIVRQVKLSATGKEVEEYAFDAALMREIRAHEEQAAKELGQWVEKKDVSGTLEVVDAKQTLIGKLAAVAARTGEHGASDSDTAAGAAGQGDSESNAG